MRKNIIDATDNTLQDILAECGITEELVVCKVIPFMYGTPKELHKNLLRKQGDVYLLSRLETEVKDTLPILVACIHYEDSSDYCVIAYNENVCYHVNRLSDDDRIAWIRNIYGDFIWSPENRLSYNVENDDSMGDDDFMELD